MRLCNSLKMAVLAEIMKKIIHLPLIQVLDLVLSPVFLRNARKVEWSESPTCSEKTMP